MVGSAFAVHALLARFGAFAAVGWSKGLQGVAFVSVAIGGAWLGETGGSAGGLVVAQLVGQAVVVAVALLSLARLQRYRSVGARPGIVGLAREYRSYPLLSSPAGLLNAFGVHGLLVAVPLLFDIDAAGYYSVAYRFVIGPAALCATAVGTVFLGSAPELHRRGELAAAIERMVSTTSRLALPVAAALVVGGPTAMHLVLGADWAPVGILVQLIAPWFVTTIVLAPLTPAFGVFGRLRGELSFQLSLLTGRLVGLAAGRMIGSFEIGIAIASAVSVVHYGWLLRLVASELGSSVAGLLAPLGRPLARSLAATVLGLTGSALWPAPISMIWSTFVVVGLAAVELYTQRKLVLNRLPRGRIGRERGASYAAHRAG